MKKYQEDYERESWEEEPARKNLYSTAGKALVMILTILAIGIASFGLVQLVVLAQGGLTPDMIAKGQTDYEESYRCAAQIENRLNYIHEVIQRGLKFGVKGKYDAEKELDYVQYLNGYETPNKSTTYTLGQLADMQETADALREPVNTAIYEYAGNDAGIDKSAYLKWEEGGYEAAEAEDWSTTETENGSDDTANPKENFWEFVPDGSVYEPSDETIKELKELDRNPNDYSSQFLYLYERGKELESEKTKAGTYLYEYAAQNPKDVSLMDLYNNLPEVCEEAVRYRSESDLTELENSNMWYLIETEDGSVLTNVDEWKDGYEKALAGRQNYKLAVAFERNGQSPKFHALIEGKNDALTSLQDYFTRMIIAEENEKVIVALDPEYSSNDIFSTRRELCEDWSRYLPALIFVTAIAAVLVIVGLVLITLQAGRNPVNRHITLYSFDRLPTEVAAAVAFAALGLGICIPIMAVEMIYGTGGYYYDSFSGMFYGQQDAWRAIVAGASVAIFAILFFLFYCSMVRRIKGKNLWRQSLLHSICHMCKEVYTARKTSQKIMILFGIYVLVQLFLFLTWSVLGVFIMLVLDVVVLLYLIRESSGRQMIKEGLRRIGGGDLEYKIDTSALYGDNLEMAETVNIVGQGLQVAVQDQTKSERLKADLITNVSHDIKTPLTSIINYVDLLKRENIQDPKVKGYIDILDSKSQRLKQLTEDLVEASKISSGNVKLEFMNLNLNELVQQINGEFDDRFRTRRLDLVCVLQPEPLVISADSRRIWRVLENLYVNVVKYAMPGTRVYVDAIRKNGKVTFSIKNISEHPLNINADELTERFIRGDVSRSTEGSGLGLSIAKNLTVLQHGTFDIYLDGDLFKVTITFDEIKETKKKEQKAERQNG